MVAFFAPVDGGAGAFGLLGVGEEQLAIAKIPKARRMTMLSYARVFRLDCHWLLNVSIGIEFSGTISFVFSTGKSLASLSSRE